MASCGVWRLVLLTVSAGHLAASLPHAGQNMHNVALSKSCNMSSRYRASGSFSNDCHAAINGNINSDYVDGNCIHSDLNDYYPHWTVNLGQEYIIHWITIYRRGNNFDRMNNVTVSIDGRRPVKTIHPSDYVQNNKLDIPIKPPQAGQVVTLARQDSSQQTAPLLNICEVQVWVCIQGYYGNSCTEACGDGCHNGRCDSTNGNCTCKSHWQPPLCKACSRGYYGTNCTNKCGAGCQNGTCNSHTGHCACKNSNWQSQMCQDCANGHYNKSSGCGQQCGHCARGATAACDIHTGHCPSCQPGWIPPLCQQKCQPGRHGQDCKERCGHCKQNASCEYDTGLCPASAGCEDGFGGQLCKHCADGHYNKSSNCDQQCGNCTGGAACNKDTGHCPSCEPGWIPPLCQQLPQSADSDSNVTGIAAGSAAAVVAVVVVVVVAVVLVRRRRMENRRDSQQKSNENDSFPEHLSLSRLSGGQAGNDKSTASSKPRAAVKPQVKHADNDGSNDPGSGSRAATAVPTAAAASLRGNTPSSAKEGPSSPSTKSTAKTAKAKRPNPPPIAAKPTAAPTPRPSGPVYENFELAGKNAPQKPAQDGASLSKGKQAIAPRGQSRKETQEEDFLEEEEEGVYCNEDLYACYSSVRSLSLLDAFQKYLLDCLAAPQKLAMEFETFPRGMLHPHAVGCQPENSSKNRFKKLCAYDKNRVILKRPEGDTDTDYINANYIKGHENERAYIATQGPRANSISDLWWLIWQEGVTQIIMLTNTKEGGKDKCDEYWPELGTTTTYGHVTVRSQEEEERADFVIRTFTLRVKGSSRRQREVHQYHYQAWSDHGVPAAGSLVNFWRYVTTRAMTTAPPLVHCSAGVGRTGTYIALDIAINRKSRGLDVNVRDIVSELREQRSIMVQTEVQYRFLHEVILEAYTSRDTRLTVDQLDIKFPTGIDVNKPNKRIDNEFKLLAEIKRWAKPNHTIAEMEENQNKNRDPNVLPDDANLAYLSVYTRGRSQYINAVFMSSFKVRRGLLLTQLPLPDTVVDLWRLVEGCGVNTIVSLGAKDEDMTVKDFCRYWPRVVGEVLKTGPYVVTLSSSTMLTPNLTSCDMIMQSKDDSRGVKVLHYTDWSGDLPGKTSDLIHLVDTLKTATDNDTSPVIIQCLDGASRSGLFCVLYDVINRMTYDKEVDVFPTVRYVHSVRPQAVTLESQYRLCYKVAQEFQRNRRVYANT